MSADKKTSQPPKDVSPKDPENQPTEELKPNTQLPEDERQIVQLENPGSTKETCKMRSIRAEKCK